MAWALFGIWLPVACGTPDGIQGTGANRDEPVTAEWVSQSSSTELDDYRQTASVRAPELEEAVAARPGEHYRVHLRGVSAKNGAETFQVYVASHLLGDWHNFRAAKDQDGIPFAVHKITRKQKCDEVQGCVFYEHFGLAVSRDYLKARIRKGIELTVTGPSSEMLVRVPPEYVVGFLARFDSERARQAAGGESSGTAAKVSFCQAKYGSDPKALAFCQEQARASYQRLKPRLDRARADAFTSEAKTLESCMRRHNGSLGLDWMLVEHCYAKAAGPASP